MNRSKKKKVLIFSNKLNEMKYHLAQIEERKDHNPMCFGSWLGFMACVYIMENGSLHNYVIPKPPPHWLDDIKATLRAPAKKPTDLVLPKRLRQDQEAPGKAEDLNRRIPT